LAVGAGKGRGNEGKTPKVSPAKKRVQRGAAKRDLGVGVGHRWPSKRLMCEP